MTDVIPSPNIWRHPDIYEQENLGVDPGGVLETVMRGIHDWTNQTVLDIGCNGGFYSIKGLTDIDGLHYYTFENPDGSAMLVASTKGGLDPDVPGDVTDVYFIIEVRKDGTYTLELVTDRPVIIDSETQSLGGLGAGGPIDSKTTANGEVTFYHGNDGTSSVNTSGQGLGLDSNVIRSGENLLVRFHESSQFSTSLKEIDSASPLYTPLLEIQNASRRSADLTRQLGALVDQLEVIDEAIRPRHAVGRIRAGPVNEHRNEDLVRLGGHVLRDAECAGGRECPSRWRALLHSIRRERAAENHRDPPLRIADVVSHRGGMWQDACPAPTVVTGPGTTDLCATFQLYGVRPMVACCGWRQSFGSSRRPNECWTRCVVGRERAAGDQQTDGDHHHRSVHGSAPLVAACGR